MIITDELSAIVGEAFEAEGLAPEDGLVVLSSRPDLAEFQCNGALAAAKREKKNPRAIGEAVAARLSAHAGPDGSPYFSTVELAGPGFINLRLSAGVLNAAMRDLARDPDIGACKSDAPEEIILDYGGPNVAKTLHVGHLRSAIIGEALKRILRAGGHKVTGDVHLGDWGLQMGQLISELEMRAPGLVYFDPHHEGPYPDEPPVTLRDLEEMYPAASAACKADEARNEVAREATRQLQAGRPGYRALWRHFVDLSIADMRRNYADLLVEFDLWKGESDADPLIDDIIKDLSEKGLSEMSDGATIVRVAREGDRKEIPPFMVQNSKGGIGYHTTDLATILDRTRYASPDRMLYVVDNRQALHFEQVFRVSDAVGYFSEDRLEHLGFGTMNGLDGKPFKTREGGVVKLRDLIDLVDAKALARLEEAGLTERYDADEVQAIARAVGLAALKFADLSSPRTTDYIFDLDKFLAFEGKTGPYLLYACVRATSVMQRARKVRGASAGGVAHAVAGAGAIAIGADEERALALTLLNFGHAMRGTIEKRLPHILCDHAFQVAQAFSKFYAACRILDEPDAPVRASRLALCDVARRQLAYILGMLAIPIPDRM